MSYSDRLVSVEVRDVCDGDLLSVGRCMLDLAEDAVEDDCRYNEKSKAGGNSMRDGIGPVDRR